MQNPVISNAENSGWTLESGTYDIKWFSGSQMPTNLQDNVADLEVNNIGESDCNYESDSDESLYSSETED